MCAIGGRNGYPVRGRITLVGEKEGELKVGLFKGHLLGHFQGCGSTRTRGLKETNGLSLRPGPISQVLMISSRLILPEVHSLGSR